MSRLTVLTIWAAANLTAQPLDLRVEGVTNTQAVLRYGAPSSAPCTVLVSESSSFTPVIHDVNPALFPGASLDSRETSLNNGTTRFVVVGRQGLGATQRGANGLWYSRALRAEAAHYVRVTCDGVSADTTFFTKPIPKGLTHVEIPDVDAAGNWIEPTFIEDRSQVIIDPYTGAEIRRLTLQSDTTENENTYSALNFFAVLAADGWSNGSAILANDSNSATQTCTTAPCGWIALNTAYLPYSQANPMYLQLTVRGFGDPADDRVIEACLSASVAPPWTCTSAIQEVTLPAGNEGVVTIGSGVPGDLWNPIGTRQPTRADFAAAGSMRVLIRKKQPNLAAAISLQHATVAVSANSGSWVPNGSSYEICSPVVDSAGYRKCLVQREGAIALLFAIHNSTGNVIHLGKMLIPQLCVPWNLWDRSNASRAFCSTSAAQLYQLDLDATNTPRPTNTTMIATATLLKTNAELTAMAQSFYSANAAQWPDIEVPVFSTWSCFPTNTKADGSLMIACRRAQQDTQTWLFRMRLSDLTFTAGLPIYAAPYSRWCSMHAFMDSGPDSYQMYLTQQIKPSGFFYTVDVTNNPGTGTTMDVTSVWDSAWGATPANWRAGDAVSPQLINFLMKWRVGDHIYNPVTGEVARITAISGTGPYTFTLARGQIGTTVQNWTSAHDLYAWCACAGATTASNSAIQYPMVFWRYPSDLYGKDATGGADRTTQSYALQDVGHASFLPGVSAGPNQLAIPSDPNSGWDGTFNLPHSCTTSFAGGLAPQCANFTQTYPSILHWTSEAGARANYYVDQRFFVGGNLSHGSCALQNGTTNVYRCPPEPTLNADGFNWRKLPMAGLSNRRWLQNVSGPNSVISDATPFAFCVAAVAGECLAGSSAGDVFASVPNVVFPFCTGGESFAGGNDICLFEWGPWMNGLMSWTWNLLGAKGRNPEDPAAFRGLDGFSLIMRTSYGGRRDTQSQAKCLPNSPWCIVTLNYPEHDGQATVNLGAMLVKLPDQSVFDSINRSTFIPVDLPVEPVEGADGVQIEYGYDLNWKATSSRNEITVANQTPDSSDWEQHRFASLDTAKVSCASGCTVRVPAISSRVLHYRVNYYQGDTLLVTSRPSVYAVP